MTSTAKRVAAGLTALLSSVACLVALRALGAFDSRAVLAALRGHELLLLGTVACQVAVSLGAIVRFRMLLALVRVRLPVGVLVSPSLVAQAVGTWLPASMAVTEALRLGITLSATGGGDRDELLARRARITVASLVDRIVGQGTMLFVGGAVGLWLILTKSDMVADRAAVLLLSAVSGAMGLGLLLLPFAGRFPWTARLVDVLSRSGKGGKVGRWLASVIANVAVGARDLAAPGWGLIMPALVSVLLLVGSCGSMLLPSYATPHPLSFTALLVGVPLLSLSTVLPLGFAGVGSQQLVALGVFSIFALDGPSVVTASLVQNALSLATTTVLGGLAALLPALAARARKQA